MCGDLLGVNLYFVCVTYRCAKASIWPSQRGFRKPIALQRCVDGPGWAHVPMGWRTWPQPKSAQWGSHGLHKLWAACSWTCQLPATEVCYLLSETTYLAQAVGFVHEDSYKTVPVETGSMSQGWHYTRFQISGSTDGCSFGHNREKKSLLTRKQNTKNRSSDRGFFTLRLLDNVGIFGLLTSKKWKKLCEEQIRLSRE